MFNAHVSSASITRQRQLSLLFGWKMAHQAMILLHVHDLCERAEGTPFKT